MTTIPDDGERDLIQRLADFELNTEEEDQVFLHESDIHEGIKDCLYSCYGKLFSHREAPLKFLRLAMVQAWNCESLKVSKVGPNLFHIFLRTADELDRVLHHRPWCLENSLSSVVKWKRGL